MISLMYSDWKYKIAFDNDIYKEVKSFCLQLNVKEREIMNNIIDFHRNNFSFEQIINAFDSCKTDKQIKDFKLNVSNRMSGLLFCPKELKKYYEDYITINLKGDESFFRDILNKALEQKPTYVFNHVLKTMLGDYYKKTINKCNFYAKKLYYKMEDKPLKDSAIPYFVEQINEEIKTDPSNQGIFGLNMIEKYKTSIVDSVGFGEWSPKDFNYSSNRLYINTNNNTITLNNLKHMMYLRVYPGNAHFYNTVLYGDVQTTFDNGATFLINGWATFVAWHYKPSLYTRNSKALNCKIQSFMFDKNLSTGYSNLYSYCLSKFNKEKAQRYLIELSQYAGRFESYILGGLATEFVIDNGFAISPYHLLNKYREVNAGDFFALYSLKKQKMLAKKVPLAKTIKEVQINKKRKTGNSKNESVTKHTNTLALAKNKTINTGTGLSKEQLEKIDKEKAKRTKKIRKVQESFTINKLNKENNSLTSKTQNYLESKISKTPKSK